MGFKDGNKRRTTLRNHEERIIRMDNRKAGQQQHGRRNIMKDTAQ